MGTNKYLAILKLPELIMSDGFKSQRLEPFHLFVIMHDRTNGKDFFT